MATNIFQYFRWQILSSLGATWWFWLAIAGLCAALEAGALIYQHVLQVLPCELCIYVRVWLTAIFLFCLLALYLRRFRLGAVLCSLSGLGLAIGLVNETYNLLKVEYDFGDGGACSFFANFPSWAPLDSWLPFLFQVQELCMATPEVLLGISMADALVVVSIGLVLAFATVSAGAIKAAMFTSSVE